MSKIMFVAMEELESDDKTRWRYLPDKSTQLMNPYLIDKKLQQNSTFFEYRVSLPDARIIRMTSLDAAKALVHHDYRVRCLLNGSYLQERPQRAKVKK